MADWRTLVGGTMEQDMQRERANPIPGVLGKLIEESKTLGKEKRMESSQARTQARGAVYGTYPEKAASDLGMELPETGAPEGMELSSVTRGGKTYKQPESLDKKFFAGQYQDFRLKAEEMNSMPWVTAGKSDKIPIPSFKGWMEENFPEYSDDILEQTRRTKEKVDLDQYLEDNGYAVNDANRKLMKDANEKGMFE